MRLRDLLHALPKKTIYGDPEGLRSEVEISGITYDSRTAGTGSLFVAIRGWEQDGHRFIPDATRRGATVVVAEELSTGLEGPLQVIVPNSRQALALMAAAFYGHPGRRLRVIGVTGTDGKTTTTNLLGAMLAAAGLRVGLLSTIRAEYGGRSLDTGLHTTTPSPVDVQRYLSEMADAGVEYAVLETTSHALDQERTLGCEFDVAVVTNVTHDHLDYHKTYGRYLAAKGRLFASLTEAYRKPGVPKVSITNVDDVSYGYLRELPADLHLTYGMESEADVSARAIGSERSTTRFRVVTPRGTIEVSSPLLGLHNVYNVLAAAAVCTTLEVSPRAIADGAASLPSLTGRWEPVSTGEDFAVIVDFAHTPHALEQALRLARTQSAGRVLVVFGCAGLRDPLKRPLMGEIAGRLADIVVITAEDPRTEDVNEIMAQIAAGCRGVGRTVDEDCFLIADRAKAIDFAVATAEPGDLVLLAGKGHERSMCIGEVEYPWSEHDAVAAALARRRAAREGAVGEDGGE